METIKFKKKIMHVRPEDVEDVWVKEKGNNRRLEKFA